MATRRTDIMNAFMTHIADNTTILRSNITRTYHVLGEVNDFPALTMVAEGERREHRGGGRKIAIFSVALRAYSYDGDGTEIIGVAETLGDELDDAVESFSQIHENGLEECRVLTFRTDEGLFSPYGITDMQVEFAYEVDTTI